MTNPGIQQKAMGIIILMSVAVNNLRLYPPTSAMISQTIDRLFQALTGILSEEDSLILAESERMLLVGGEPAGPKDQERPQVRAFIETFVNIGIKSISFVSGVEKEEVTAFLQELGQKPEAIRADGGLRRY